MFPVYAAALAVGGSLLLASLLLGHHGGDHDAELDVDGGVEVDAGGEVEAEVETELDAHGHAEGDGDFGLFVTFLSIRFWTFASAFFGLTGVIFDKLELASGRATLGLAIGVGLGTGLVVTWVIGKLKKQVVNSLPSEVGYAGLTGEMLLEATADESGRIRIVARGSTVDLPARSQNREHLPKGSKALVVDVTDGVACVAPAPKGENA